MSRTFVIAEAGSTHDGEYEQALRLITAAKAAEADACKFQYWSSATRLAERRHAPTYEAIYAKYQVPAVWLSWLLKACEVAGIEFMATVYLPEDVSILDRYVWRWKVASFEHGDGDLLTRVIATGKPVIASTGMTGQDCPAFDRPGPYRTSLRNGEWQVQFLHCVSAYPTPLDQASLGVLRSMNAWDGRAFIGYSDHTRSTLTGGLAVAAGAEMLEVHVRLDDTDPANPDYATALTPAQLRDYVDFVRLTERMLGDGIKKPQLAEAEMSQYRVQP